jgi:hypothetical protein
MLISTTGGSFGGSQPSALGAPGPENLNSPRADANVLASLIDPTTATSAAPNRVRQFCGSPGAPACPSDPNTSASGYLSFRRKFTNNTGHDITRLRFRIVDMTTLGNTGGLPAPVADLRAVTSPDVTVSIFGLPLQVKGTTLEQSTAQPNGGGLNSTFTAGTISLDKPLASGAEINVQFLMGVQSSGRFRFFVNVEALP